MTNVSLKDLIESGAHFGHQSRRWNPKMAQYIHGVQDGVHVFDLLQTKECLEAALAELKKASKEGKTILLLATKKQAKEKVVEVAKEAGVFFVNERWLGGTVTNFDQIKKSTRKLKEMKEKLAKGEYKDRTKKERLLIKREIDRLTRFFGGIETMQAPPDVLVVIDTKREFVAVKEAEKGNITTIGVVDSNADPTFVTYPIPMNDDATRAVHYVLELVRGRKFLLGRKKIATKESKKAEKKKLVK